MREQRKANREHYCDCCGRRIYPGMEYIAENDIAHGRRVTRKLHIHCDALLEIAGRETPLSAGKRYVQLRHWLEETVCSRCRAGESCDQNDVYSCAYVLLEVLPASYGAAATKSMIALEEYENGDWHE